VLGNATSVHLARWPAYDPELTRAERVTCVLQVDGKVRDRLQVDPETGEDDLRAAALASAKVQTALGGRAVARVVVVPPKLVNVVTAK
jgi:leucyl-tRNA synthetase